jgi:RNA polymerase sigma-70 factor, ECF subfamily
MWHNETSLCVLFNGIAWSRPGDTAQLAGEARSTVLSNGFENRSIIRRTIVVTRYQKGKVQIPMPPPNPLLTDLAESIFSASDEEQRKIAVDEFVREVVRIALIKARQMGQQADAEDIAQCVAIKLLANLSTLEGVEYIPAWVHKVARNEILDSIRRKNTRGRHESSLDYLIESTRYNPPSAPDDPEPALLLRECLQLLSEDERRVIQLVVLQGWTLEDVARQTGMATSTLHRRVHRALEKLRNCIKGPPAEESSEQTDSEGTE